MKCKFCKGKCVKYGVQIDGTQRYKCKKCGKTQQGDYKYKAYDTDIDNQIVLLTKEGVSIRRLGRCLGVSVSTVLVRIKKIADGIEIPRIKPHREYEVDEMWTFLGNKHKPLWIAYALDGKSKEVVAFKSVASPSKCYPRFSRLSTAQRRQKSIWIILYITCRWFHVKSMSEENGEQLI